MAETAYQEVDQDLMMTFYPTKDAHEYGYVKLQPRRRRISSLKRRSRNWINGMSGWRLSRKAATRSIRTGESASLPPDWAARFTQSGKRGLHRKNIILKEKLQAKPKDAEAAASALERLLADFEQLVDVNEYKLDRR